ncbi:hypothetical protein FKM82_024661 [Ascaphus truei]
MECEMQDLIGSQERDFMRGDAETDLGKSRVILAAALRIDCRGDSGKRVKEGRRRVRKRCRMGGRNRGDVLTYGFHLFLKIVSKVLSGDGGRRGS